MTILAECPICHTKWATKKKLCKKCGTNLDEAKQSKKVRYWVDYRLPDGRQKREAVSGENINPYSIDDARAFQSKRIVQKRENKIFDIKPDSKMTFQELSDWYLGLEKVKSLSSYWRVKICLKNFNVIFGNIIASQIKPADLENYQAKRKAEGRADKTIDDEVGQAQTIVTKAFNNDIISGDTLKTFKRVNKLLKRNKNVRTRVLSSNEYKRLFDKVPHHLKGIIATAYYTGMREGEILNLTWPKVSLKERMIKLEASDTKDKEPRVIPICDNLYKVLKILPKALHDPHAFLNEGKPIKSINKALRTACEKTGITWGRFVKDGFVFHDLRHTFNTNMRKAGVPESVIMQITGHSTREMFDRYNTIDTEDTRRAIDQLQNFLNVDYSVDQVAKNESNENNKFE
jgi:integrase